MHPEPMSASEERYFERFLKKSGIAFRGRVLDAGCGNGRFAKVISKVADSVWAVDIEPHAEWDLESNVRFSVGDAEQLAFGDGSFDTVIAMNVLHHTAAPRKAIAELLRVCKTGGQVILIEPNRHNPLGYVHLTLLGGHQHFSTRRFLQLATPVFPSVALQRFECHCYPVADPWLSALERIEDVLDRMRWWKPFIFYNVVVGTKAPSVA